MDLMDQCQETEIPLHAAATLAYTHSFPMSGSSVLRLRKALPPDFPAFDCQKWQSLQKRVHRSAALTLIDELRRSDGLPRVADESMGDRFARMVTDECVDLGRLSHEPSLVYLASRIYTRDPVYGSSEAS